MIIPKTHEQLRKNILVIGADVIELIRSKPYNIEKLFQQMREKNNINLEQFYNTIIMLWLLEAIDVQGNELFMK